MITLSKDMLVWVWGKCPTIIKLYLGAIVLPNLIVFSLLLFVFGIPFIDDRLHSHTKPMKEARDRQIEEIMKSQTYELKLIHSEMSRFSRQHDIMMQELMRRHNP